MGFLRGEALCRGNHLKDQETRDLPFGGPHPYLYPNCSLKLNTQGHRSLTPLLPSTPAHLQREQRMRDGQTWGREGRLAGKEEEG